MSDKNFKVKSGLQVPSLTTAGPVVTDNSGNVTSSATLPISQGGTGQTTAGNALNALLPLQTSQDNKFLQTNGVSTQWTIPQQQTSTDGSLGYKIYSGTVTPSSPVVGDLWIDQTTGNGIQLVRWRKTIASAASTLSGLDDNNLTLTYTAGNEQVYINGTLITRGQDYTATNGTSISLTQAVEVGDTVEIFGNPLFSVTDTYTQAQADSRYVNYSGLNAAGKNYIINGGMDIWQRGTNFTSPSGAYTVDRFKVTQNGPVGTYTATQQSSGLPGFNYCLRVQRSSGQTASGGIFLGYASESGYVIPLQGKTVTFSFYARAGANYSGNASGLSYQVNTGTGPGTHAFTLLTNETTVLNSGATLTTGWLRYSNTFTIPSNATELRINWSYSPVGTASTNDYFDITGVQLEIGSYLTQFTPSAGNIQGELLACQRYFYTLPYNYNNARNNPYTDFLMMNTADQTSWARGIVNFPVTMRSTPSLESPTAANYYLLSSTGVLSITSIGIDNMTNASMAVVNAYRNSLSTGTTYFLRFANNTTDYLRFSAEL